MTEFRCDLELPFVLDTDKDVIEKLAEGFMQTVGSDIPGVGIAHDYAMPTTHRGAHYWHRNLLLLAAKMVAPQVHSNDHFIEGITDEDFGERTRTHVDLNGSVQCGGETGAPFLVLRLHTADPINGAQVAMANSRPGLATEFGDSDLYNHGYRLEDKCKARGYDIDGNEMGCVELQSLGLIDEGSYEPVTTDNRIFHFTQRPLYSVMFRSFGSFGPVSIHSFEALDLTQKRPVLSSDLLVYSQSL